MFGKNRNKKVGLCVMVVTACLVLAALWAVLAAPETALAKKPTDPPGGGGGGNDPVCVAFGEGGGVQSDDGGDYCNDKKLKVKAIMTQDGHVDLRPNTESWRGEQGRTLKVYTNVDPVIPLVGWRFFVGVHDENFDMRAMKIGEEFKRDDVRLMINTKTPDTNEIIEKENWWLIFGPSYERWHINFSESTHVTVKRIDETTWVIENTTVAADGTTIIPSKAVLAIETKVEGKNWSDFAYGGVVTVPPFTATVTLVP